MGNAVPENFVVSFVRKIVGSKFASLILGASKSFLMFGSIIEMSIGLVGGLKSYPFRYGMGPLGNFVSCGQIPVAESSDLGGSSQEPTIMGFNFNNGVEEFN